MANSDTHLYNRQESSSKLFPFIHIFNELWKAGETAYIDLNTHAGEAWINIRTPLGKYTNSHSPKYPQYPSFTNANNTPQPHHNTTRSPSYFRRLQSRKLARATNTEKVNESAEQVALKLTHNSTLTGKVIPKLNESAEKVSLKTTPTTKLTEKVISQHLTKGFSAEVEPLKAQNTILTYTNTNEAEKLNLTHDSAKPNTHEFFTQLLKTKQNTTLTEKVISQNPMKGYAAVVKSLKTKNTPSTETKTNKADKLKLTLDSSTLNTDEVIKTTSAHTTFNTDSKMSPKSHTKIPTTSIKNTPVPSHTLLQHKSNSTTHTTKTYAEKHNHNTETITPNTKTTSPNTDGNSTTNTTKTYAEKHNHTTKTSTPNTKTTTPKTYAEKHKTITPNTITTIPSTETPKRPLKPPKIFITPPPEDITYTKKIGHIRYGGKKGTKSYYFI